mmetsp:Transcript_24797/g.52148  ORF Transcript_24797/g.52148 Transcript_24797/m.52148 type:complete len:222 (-) Transcript_24797:36-701(-)
MDVQRPVFRQGQKSLGEILPVGRGDAQIGPDFAFELVQEIGVAGFFGGEDGEAQFFGDESDGAGEDFSAAFAAFGRLGDGGDDGVGGGGGGLGVVVEGAEGGGGYFGCAEEEDAGDVVVRGFLVGIGGVGGVQLEGVVMMVSVAVEVGRGRRRRRWDDVDSGSASHGDRLECVTGTKDSSDGHCGQDSDGECRQWLGGSRADHWFYLFLSSCFVPFAGESA